MYGNVSWYGRNMANFPHVEAGGCFGLGGTNQRSMLKNSDTIFINDNDFRILNIVSDEIIFLAKRIKTTKRPINTIRDYALPY